jgi:GntR family transcriptional regulator
MRNGDGVTMEEPQARYRQLAALLRGAIEAGEYAPGSMLPSEPELATRYGVSRDVVNRAVRSLRSQGLVRVIRGRGAVVREIPPLHRNGVAAYQQAAREHAGAHGAFDSEIRALGLEPRSETEVSAIPAPPAVAEALGLAGGDPVILRMRRMYANGVPVQIALSYIPQEIAGGTQLAEADTGPGGLISRFRDLGYEQERITESVRVRPAAADEQAFLRLEDDQPVIEIWHTAWTAAARPVELAVHVVAASQWVLDYEWLTS